jgi:hypothetical protein
MHARKEAVATWTAVGALVAFLVLVAIMLTRVDARDPEWSRLAFLLTGVEAIAFGGGGFLWGKAVTRARAERAERMLQALGRSRIDRDGPAM